MDTSEKNQVYRGDRTIDGIMVTVDGEPLDERYDIHQFTALGFEWTYLGDSPQQLALAMLAHHLGDDQKALEFSEAFMRKVVADLDNEWEITSSDIDTTLALIGI